MNRWLPVSKNSVFTKSLYVIVECFYRIFFACFFYINIVRLQLQRLLKVFLDEYPLYLFADSLSIVIRYVSIFVKSTVLE